MLSKIISGGQTGADRAALDAGMESGFPVGGSCPSGRIAEDGPIDPRYPLEEVEGGSEERTRKNVEDASATVIFFDRYLHGGSEKTLAFCIELDKPYKLIDIEQHSLDLAANLIVSFLSDYKITVLNVAGPRQSHCPSIYSYVKSTIHLVITRSPR